MLNSYFDLTGSGAKAMRCRQSGDFATASMNSDYVAANAARIERTGTCSGSDTNLLDTTSLASVYNLVSAGDYRPATGSPLIDAGMPGTVIDPGTEDADGLDRVFDGNGDLSDRIDIGAYEYQPAMKPAVTFTASPTPVDAGQTVNFNATASDPDGGAVTVSWHFGDFPGGTGTGVSHVYTSAGDFNVVATATDNEGQSSTATRTVHVNSTPPTTPTADADLTEAVRGESITFTASGSNDPDSDAFTYEWTFTGGGTATGASVQRAATTVGTFTATVRAVDSHNEESPSDSVSVTINNRDPGVPVVTKDVPTAFRGDTFTFSDTTVDPDGDTMSRVWNFGDGTVTAPVSAGSQTHSYSSVGVKTVSVAVADAYGGSNSGSTTVEVLDRAPVLGALTRAGGSKIGDAQSFGISATDADGDPVSFSWNFGDGGSASGATATHAYAAAGTYSVVASGDDGQGSVVTAQTSVTIDPATVTISKATKKFKKGKKSFALGALVSKPHVPVVASSATTVTLSLSKYKTGWLKGTKCSAKKPATGKKRCDLKLAGSQVLQLPAGSSRLGFAGVWAKKKLAPGRYRLTVTPAGGAPG
ncbi:MAG: PKD domain-containing protein, partial [Solirubrobacterales bacterium]